MKKMSLSEYERRSRESARQLLAWGGVDAGSKRKSKKDVEVIDAEEAAKRIKRKMKETSAVTPISVGMSAAELDAMDLRIARLQAEQAIRTQRAVDGLDRAEYQAHTEIKLGLKPGAIHRHVTAEKKAKKQAELVRDAFSGIAPSALRALRLNGLTDVQIAAIVIAHRVAG